MQGVALWQQVHDGQGDQAGQRQPAQQARLRRAECANQAL